MAKKVEGYIKLQIPAGKATPAPPVGPALGQHGVNIVEFTKQFNARTADKGDLIINYAYVANVGDSRLYLAADGIFDQVTQDHSLIAEMVRLGELTPEQARNHPDKNIITRAVGTQDTVKIDFFDIQLEEGNQLVMCSDGLSNMVTDEEIFEIICREDGEDKAKRLIDQANANGGRDNIAVIVVEPFTNEVKEC